MDCLRWSNIVFEHFFASVTLDMCSVQDYFVFVNGLEGTLLLRKPLDYETLSNFSIAIRAQVRTLTAV